MKFKFEDPHLNAVFNTPPGEPMPKRKAFVAVKERPPQRIEAVRTIKQKRYRSLSDLYFAYCAFAAGGVFLTFSPAVMESTESAGGGDLKWIFPAAGVILLALGTKLVRGSK